MRPLRALAMTVVLLALWIAWRIPIAREDLAALLEPRAARPTYAPDMRPRTPSPYRVEARGEHMIASGASPPAAASLRPTRAIEAETAQAAPESRPIAGRAEAMAEAPRTEEPDRDQAFTFAEQGYRLLTAGDRRAAAAAFDRALSLASGSPAAAAWRAERARLRRRWSGEVYTLLRARGAPSPGGLPLLGGSQSGVTLGYRPDPLAERPVLIFLRASVAHGHAAAWDDRSAGAAAGIAWRPLAALPITLAGERLLALGPEARAAWSLRVAGGFDAAPAAGAGHWLDRSFYAEAGIVGASRRDLFASAQARIAAAMRLTDDVTLSTGAGLWASAQRTDRDIGRADFGPSIRLSLAVAPATFDIGVDYRMRIAGNAAPGSGPALTLAGRF